LVHAGQAIEQGAFSAVGVADQGDMKRIRSQLRKSRIY
jgi:hypothetical protein